MTHREREREKEREKTHNRIEYNDIYHSIQNIYHIQ